MAFAFRQDRPLPERVFRKSASCPLLGIFSFPFTKSDVCFLPFQSDNFSYLSGFLFPAKAH